MTEYSWKSAVSGNWNTGKDWSPDGGPTVVQQPFDTESSPDSALFAASSRDPYTIKGTAYAKDLTISHNTVTFKNFNFSDVDYTDVGPTMTIENEADVTVSSDSIISLLNYELNDPYGTSGELLVANAHLTIHGFLESDPDIEDKSVVTVLGSAADLAIFPGDHVGAQYGVLAKGSTLNVENGGRVTGGFKSVNGTINVTGSKSYVSGAIINSDGSINGSDGASIQGNGFGSPMGYPDFFSNNGTITAPRGLFRIDAGTPGTGTLVIDKGATLELGSGSSNNVVFLNQANLVLDKGVITSGFMQSFGTSDTIDLVGLTASSVAASGDGANTLLSLYDGSSIAEQLTFKGHYMPGNFFVKTDLSGSGTLIAFEAHHIMSPIPVT